MSELNLRVLEIIEVEDHEDGWLVGGLAFETIQVNDYLTVSETKQADITSSLKVASISFYSQQVSEIDRGLTARIWLLGNQESFPKETKYLYKIV